MRGDATDIGPLPGAAAEGTTRFRIAISRRPWWSRRWIGLLFLALAVLPWLPRDATPARRVRGVGRAPILTFAFAPDSETIATIQMDGRVALRGAAGGAPSFLDYRGFANALAFTPDGRSLAVGGTDADIRVYDLGVGGVGRPLGMPSEYGKGLAFSPDGRVLAASSYVHHEILLWDFTAGRERPRLRGHGSPVISLAFAPDGLSLASGGWSDEAIILWDLAASRPRRRLGVPREPVTCLAYSPDGRWLASTGLPGRQSRLWDLEGRCGDRVIGILSRARDPLAFSPDGRLLATAGEYGAVRLWDLASNTELRRVGVPGDRLTGVAFSPDGRLLAASGTDADIRLWDLGEVLKARGRAVIGRPGRRPSGPDTAGGRRSPNGTGTPPST
jgi:WD40 repeat protein